MNEQAIATFIEFAECDRRTAMWCMERHSNNMNLALSYYFDNASRIVIPPEYDGSAPRPPSVSNELRRSMRHMVESPPTPPPFQPPPPNPTGTTPRLLRNVDAYKKEEPFLFVPFGAAEFEKPRLAEISVAAAPEGEAEAVEEIFPDAEAEHVKCILWKNGISWGDEFHGEDEEGCAEAARQIERNRLPTALIPEIGACDVELIFRRNLNYKESLL